MLDDLSVLDKNSQLSYVGDRIDYYSWQNSDKLEERYIVCQIDDICYRYINRVSLSNFVGENVLYDKDIQKKYLNVLPPDNIKRAFINVIEQYSNSMHYTPIRQAHLGNVKDVISTHGGIFNEIMNNSFAPNTNWQIILSKCGGVQIKQAHKKGWKSWNEQSNDRKLPSLQCFLISSEMGVEGVTLHQAPCWFCMSCTLCGKNIFFKKDTPREKYDHYMTKMILSLWTIHIFSIEIEDVDEHKLCNKGWNKCEKREYEHYEKLRRAQVNDESTYSEVELNEAYVAFTKSLEMFFSIFHENYSGILKNISVYSIDLRLQKVREEKLRRIKESRKSLNSSIDKEQKKINEEQKKLTEEQRIPAVESNNNDKSIENNETESNSLPGESILFGKESSDNTNEKNTNKDEDKELKN